MPKSAKEKLATKTERKIADTPTGTLLIPTPQDLIDIIKDVPKGKIITTGEIAEKLAEKFGTDKACPLVTGIFIRLIAESTEEDRIKDKKTLTPWWRIIKSDKSLNTKYPGEGELQSMMLHAEGHKIVKKGKKLLVE